MLTDITQTVLTKALDGAALRHRAVANNIANAETPGYRRQEVGFETALRAALDEPAMMESRRTAAVAQVEPTMAPDADAPAREDGNTVDVDQEMVQLAENAIQYQAVLQAYTLKSGMMRSAIHEGRR